MRLQPGHIRVASFFSATFSSFSGSICILSSSISKNDPASNGRLHCQIVFGTICEYFLIRQFLKTLRALGFYGLYGQELPVRH